MPSGVEVGEIRRKITTLLSADVIGYGGPIEADDPATFRTLTQRRETFQRLVTEYGGRQFGGVGHSRMVEFPSALSALQCAIAIQRAALEENESLPLEQRILLRIALNVGEVIDEGDGGLYGEGINVAAELQASAVPGGISLSGSVHEHVRHTGHFEFDGERHLKGIADPVSVYQVLEPGIEHGHHSFWSELRRRNVVRVGAAYGVVSWLLIQVADTLLPTFDAPNWLMRAFVITLIAGFPVALLLAWIYELTPLGLMRNDQVLQQANSSRLTGRRLDGAIIVMLAAAVVFLVFDNYDLIGANDAVTARESIAVLAFQNQSPDPEKEYFSDGLADELLNVLARIPELRVAPRTSSFSFKGRSVDAATIADTLMVDNVLEGSVRADGDQIRVTATLVRGGAVLWTDTFDRAFVDVLDVQAEIASAVASAIVPVLSPESKLNVERHPTDNVEAYDFYLRGQDYLNRPGEQDTLAIAADMFTRAIGLDPRFAAAWAARCEARLNQYIFSGRDEQYFADAETDCRRAWRLDNSLWEVYVALGRLYGISGQYDDAIDELRTAISQQPSAVEAYVALGDIYSAMNRNEEAESMFLSALSLDGGNWDVYNHYGHFFYDNHRYEEAIAQYQRVVDFTPDSGIGWDNLGNAYWAIGEFERAAEIFRRSLEIRPSRWAYSSLGSMQYYLGQFEESVENQRLAIAEAPEDHISWGRLAEAYSFIPGAEDEARSAWRRAIELARSDLQINPDDWDTHGQLALYHAFIGEYDVALQQLERVAELAPNEPQGRYYAALVHWQRGDADATYDALEAAIDLGYSSVFIVSDPTLADLRDEPRFAEFFR